MGCRGWRPVGCRVKQSRLGSEWAVSRGAMPRKRVPMWRWCVACGQRPGQWARARAAFAPPSGTLTVGEAATAQGAGRPGAEQAGVTSTSS